MEEQEMCPPIPSSRGSAGERFQRLACFLFAIILRLEGLERRQRAIDKNTTTDPDTTNAADGQDGIRPDDRVDLTVSPCPSTSNRSDQISSPTSTKSSGSSSRRHHQSDSKTSNHDQRKTDDSSPESQTTTSPSADAQPTTSAMNRSATDIVNLALDNANDETADMSMKSPCEIESQISKNDDKRRELPSTAIDVKSDEHVAKHGCCPCQIFFTPAAEFNLNPRLTMNDKWLMTPGDYDNISNHDTFSTPELAPRKLTFEEATNGKTVYTEASIERRHSLDDDETTGDWKRLKVSLLAEASSLYRDALYKAHSVRMVEHGVHQALAKIIVKSVLAKTAEIWNKSGRIAEAEKAQKPRVKFNLVESEGTLEKRTYEPPRIRTPYRPASTQRYTPVKFVKMLREKSVTEDPVMDSTRCRDVKPVVDIPGAAKNAVKSRKEVPPSPLSVADISNTKTHQDSPPVPFRLRTSKPACNKLLRRIVEKHFGGDESVELDDSDLDESITATGDAKKPIEKGIPTGPVFSSVTTQTDDDSEQETNLVSNVSMKATGITAARDDHTMLDLGSDVQQLQSRGMQTDLSLSGAKEYSDAPESIPNEPIIRKIDEHNTEIESLKTPVLAKLKTTTPHTSQLLRDAVERHASVTDSSDTIPDSMDTTVLYRQHSEGIVDDVPRSAQLLAERAQQQQQADEERTIQQIGPFGTLFDRNTPNVPDSAKETLNIATPKSRDDVAFRRSSPPPLVEPTCDGRFQKKIDQEAQTIAPNRMSVAHHTDTPLMKSTDAGSTDKLDDIPREEDIYLSADSGASDEEFMDAHSQSPRDARQLESGLMLEEEATDLVHGSIVQAIARIVSKDIINTSLDIIEENDINFTGNVSHQISQEFDSWNKATENVSNECVTAAPSSDHTYLKIDVGDTRDSATTIETVGDSQGGESGFSDAQSSISDLQIISSEDDDQVIREIITSLMRRAVSMVLDETVTDWAERLELGMMEDQEKFATPDEERSEAESGISTTSSFHSASSAVTDVTLLAPDENAPTPTPGHLPSPAQEISMSYEFYSRETEPEQTTEDTDDSSMVTEDSLTQIAFFKDQLADVKTLAEQYQQKTIGSDDTTSPDVNNLAEQYQRKIGIRDDTSLPDVKTLAEQYQQKIAGRDGSPSATWAGFAQADLPVVLSKSLSAQCSTLDEPMGQSSATNLKKAISLEPVKRSKAEIQEICGNRSTLDDYTSNRGSTDLVEVFKEDHLVPQFDEAPVPVAHVTLTSTGTASESTEKHQKLQKKISDKYLKVEKKTSDTYLKLEKKTSAGRVEKRRVKTHITFWERIGKRRRASKNREKPVKPETPAKENIEKFEQIIAHEASSASESEHEIAVSDVKKRSIRGRLTDKLHQGPLSNGQLWKNSAFFAALKSQSSKESDSHSQESENEINLTAVCNTKELGLQVADDWSDHTPAESEDQASSGHSEDTMCDTSKDEPTVQIEPVVDSHVIETSTEIPTSVGIDELIRPSQSEEEIQLWMEKCKRIKDRTAKLLNRCTDGESLMSQDATSNLDHTFGGIPAIASDPSVIGSHDTGDVIFPYGVTAGGSRQSDTFNIDAHLAAMEQDSDWVASSDDMIATRVDNMMKESDETLRKIDDLHADVKGNDEQVKDDGVKSDHLGEDDVKSLTMMDDAIFESAIDVQSTPSPIKKKRKFKLFNLFRSKKSRKKKASADKLDTSKESRQSCYSRASNATYDDESYTVPDGKPMPPDIWDESEMNLAIPPDIWDDSAMNLAMAESGATLTNASLGSSLDEHDASQDDSSHPKRSLRKRLFSFGGLKKSNKHKSSRHTLKNCSKS